MKFHFLVSISILLITLAGAAPKAQAENYQRTVNMEWDPIEIAKSYELELTSLPKKEGEKPLLFKTETSEWSGALTPGDYQMRIRSRDKRHVPGEWSQPEAFKVGLDPVKLVSPKSSENLKVNEIETVAIDFKWDTVGGADIYRFQLKDEDGKIISAQDLKENQVQIKLPVAQKYFWSVVPISAQGIESESPTRDQFTVYGKKLTSPEIEKPKTEFVREINWSKPEKAEVFDYSLSKWNSKDKKWEQVSLTKDYTRNKISFDSKWSGGKYKFVTRARAKLRDTSEKSEIQFQVHSGDRSPASEFTQTVRQSIDRTNGWYGIASYLITSMNYKGTIYDQGGAAIGYNALGGTGRVGLGYLGQKSPWGFLGIIDYSGFSIDDKISNFASGEFSAVYRPKTTDRSESRHYFGTFYKELPVLLADSQGNFTRTDKVASTGPQYGYEYSYAFSPKFGFQVNGHIYYSMFKAYTPNDMRIKESLSYQLGTLGSYRLSDRMTGLAGYAYRHDELGYKATDASESTNTITIEGHYLNFFLEWSL